MSFRLRPMRVDDIAATMALRTSTLENAITLEEMRDDYGVTPESVASGMAKDLFGWVCEEAAELLGFAMGDCAGGEVVVIAVRPGHEARGIGAALLTRVEARLFEAGHERIWLYANPDPLVRASGFYQRMGWVSTGRVHRGDVILERRRPA